MMNATIGGWAWLAKKDLSTSQLESIRSSLTLIPRKVGDYPGEETRPIHLFTEDSTRIGVAREYFLEKAKGRYELNLDVTEGDKERWAGPIAYTSDPKRALRAEQLDAVRTITGAFKGGTFGGILRAAPGWGKTVGGCAIIAELQVPTLVVVHKEFLMNQWAERIVQYLPGAQVGFCQQDVCDYEGKHVVIAMVHSLSQKEYPQEFYDWPGLVLTDEVHRIGASTWSQVPPRFRARWRLGVSATPRRKDGADDVFKYHIGPILYVAKEQRLKSKVRRVWTNFTLPKSMNFNPNLMNKSLLLRFLCSNTPRNAMIVEQMVLAAKSGRKLLILSERLEHLSDLEKMFTIAYGDDPPTMDYYVGGRKQEQLDKAATASVIFATAQLAQEGLDIPALDTLFLVTPLSDIEQAVGRILRPHEGKKEPIVVDFIDDKVPLCSKFAETRERYYRRTA